MKRYLIVGSVLIALVSVVCIVVAAVQVPRWLNRSGLSYIEQTTGITFPSNISDVDIFDNAESFIVAHVRLQHEDIDPFVAQYGFAPMPFIPLLEVDTLSPENREIPAVAGLGLEGRSTTSRWRFVLEQASGRLWVVVYYPDASGTLP
ncbi:MAG: hypothetical protein JXB07_17865 [Anaerolineae bacterium]|nr:hypothetical protein [Anaerolineae bacterium]